VKTSASRTVALAAAAAVAAAAAAAAVEAPTGFGCFHPTNVLSKVRRTRNCPVLYISCRSELATYKSDMGVVFSAATLLCWGIVCGSRSSTRSPSSSSSASTELFDQGHISAGINFDKYDDIPVEATGNDVPTSVAELADLDLGEVIRNNCALMGYNKFTPVQKHSVPIVCGGRDLMACAQTGSGKTAAFLIPVLQRMMESGPPPPPDGRCVTHNCPPRVCRHHRTMPEHPPHSLCSSLSARYLRD
jgi:hypothetical protein